MTGAAFGSSTVLVTGGNGFIGRHLRRRLAALGAHVHCSSRTAQPSSAGITWWQGDAADYEFLRNLMTTVRPDIVFHLSGQVTGIRDRDIVRSSMQSNLVSAVNLLDLAEEAGSRRIVLVGSLEEGRALTAGAPPSSPYAASKAASTLYAHMYASLYATPVVTARLFMVYGPDQANDTKLIPYVIKTLLFSDTMPEFGSGHRRIDWIYIDDCVDGLIACAVAPNIDGQVVDIGSGNLISIRRTVESIRDLIDPARPLRFGTLGDRPYEQEHKAEVKSAAAILGWRSSMKFRDGLTRTIDHYRRQEHRLVR